MSLFSSVAVRRLIVLAGGLLFSLSSLQAELRLPAVFSDHMVLQAGREVTVWGWATPGAEVKAELISEGKPVASTTATAGSDGKWIAKLPAIPAKTKGEYKVTSKGEEKIVSDVLVGEVWFASGQSNMEFVVGANNVPQEMRETAVKIADASANNIRIFLTAHRVSNQPEEDVSGVWKVATGKDVGPLPATPFYFAEALYSKLQVPVGVVKAAWGGTPIEGWISREAVEANPVGKTIWDRHLKQLAEGETQMADYPARLAAWNAANPTPEDQKKNRRTKPQVPYSKESRNMPGNLYNGVIHGLIPYTVQGFIWYQGESNASRPAEYADLIRALITSWRKDWNEELPFYYVELAALKKPQADPAEVDRESLSWAYIREGQQGALALPKTGVATAVDLGDVENIHPPYKRQVGQRLAGMALADVYGHDELVRSPELADFSVEGNKVRIKLKYADGLKVRGTEGLKGFAIAGADQKWVWADAEIEGEDILVSSKDVAQPVAVRYAWASNPILSVENAAGLPLRPFRTDKDSAQ